MADLIGQDRVLVWFQKNGPSTAWVPFGIEKKGVAMSGITIPFAGQTPVYGRNEFGQPVVIKKNQDAPSDLPTATLAFYEQGQIDLLQETAQTGCPLNVQRRFVPCGRLNNPNDWGKIQHFETGIITSYSPGDAPALDFNGEAISNEASISFDFVITLVDTTLSALTSGQDQNILAIAGIADEDCGICGNGYPGADKILVVGVAADLTPASEVEGIVSISTNGGGSWTDASTFPFVGTASDWEDISFIQIKPVGTTTLRMIVGTKTSVATVPAQIAWEDVEYGAESATTAWNVSTIGSNAETIEAMNWLLFDRLYYAVNNEIYVNENQGESAGTDVAIYSGAVVFNGFSITPDKNTVWAWGASNAILREQDQNDLFEARVGPSGGGAFTELTVANNGTIYAGNGTSIYSSTDQANTSGNWTNLKNFGTNKIVTNIQCIGGSRALGGSSQLLRVVVDDTGGADGQVWLSVDGGASFVSETILANLGYNDAYFSETNDNLAIIVGDVNAGGAGVIQRLAKIG